MKIDKLVKSMAVKLYGLDSESQVKINGTMVFVWKKSHKNSIDKEWLWAGTTKRLKEIPESYR